MKQILRKTLLLLFGGVMSTAAWADGDVTTIGKTDCTSNDWEENQYYALKANETLHVEFVNHNKGTGGNYHNFLIRLTNDQTPTNTYVCYRADNFGWGDCYDGGLCECNWAWETFMSDVNGASVTLDVIREDNIVTINANVTTTGSVSYYQKYYTNIGTTDDIYVGLSCSLSYLVIDNTKTTTTTTAYTNEGLWTWSHSLASASDGVSIQGDGTFVPDPYFGTVYQNNGTAKRTNYLKLPSDLLSHSRYTHKMTIGFWVNASDATPSDYNWTPIFSAYANAPTTENTSPMFVAQYRGLLQVNNHGWSNYTAEQNTKTVGTNTEYNDNAGKNWLADNKWHYYTLVLDGNNAKVYFDGELKNEWEANISYGTPVNDRCTQRGLFLFGSELDYVCLGGNQAWNWNDNDSPFKFAKFRAQNSAMTQAQIKAQMDADLHKVSVGATEWSTFASDYILDFSTVSEVSAYMITGLNGDKTAITLSDKVTGAVPAGTPLLINATSDTYTIPVAASSNTDVSANKLKRGTGGAVVKEAGKTKYVLVVDGENAVFKKINLNSAVVPTYKAYLEIDEEIASREILGLYEGGTTAIQNMKVGAEDKVYYNLQGQRVLYPTKGLYVVNGKKVIIK